MAQICLTSSVIKFQRLVKIILTFRLFFWYQILIHGNRTAYMKVMKHGSYLSYLFTNEVSGSRYKFSHLQIIFLVPDFNSANGNRARAVTIGRHQSYEVKFLFCCCWSIELASDGFSYSKY